MHSRSLGDAGEVVAFGPGQRYAVEVDGQRPRHLQLMALLLAQDTTVEKVEDFAQAVQSAGERQTAYRGFAVDREPRQRLRQLGRLQALQLLVGQQLAQGERVGIEQASQIRRLWGGPRVTQVVVAFEHARQALNRSPCFDRCRPPRATELVVDATQLRGVLPHLLARDVVGGALLLEGVFERLFPLGELLQRAIVLEPPQRARVQVRQALLVLGPQPQVHRRRIRRMERAFERQQIAGEHAQRLLEGDPRRIHQQ